MDPIQTIINQGLENQQAFINDQAAMDQAFREGIPVMNVLKEGEQTDDHQQSTNGPEE